MLVTLIAILFSVLSTAIMSYLCLAMPIGPWMEGTLVFLGIISFRLLVQHASVFYYTRAIGLATAAGGIGGIAATAVAYSFPTLYFLEPALFNAWLAYPFYFASIMAGLVFLGGACAFVYIETAQHDLLADPSLPFPIGQMVNKMISAQNQMVRALELSIGAVSTFVFNIVQSLSGIVPSKITLIPAFTMRWWHLPALTLHLNVLPMLIAIGFVSGTMIAVPLMVGLISKLFLVDTIHQAFFSYMSNENMTLAFGGGMVLYGAVMSFVELPHAVINILSQRIEIGLFKKLKTFSWEYFIPVFLCSMIYFAYFGFSVLSQLYVIIGSLLCLQQVLIIAGKQGIAPLGRFATFLMIPGLLIFGYTPIQLTLMATFVELVVGIGADIMFGRKMAQLSHIELADIRRYQWLGLIVCALSIGAITWLLVHGGGLGGEILCAQRARARATLVQVYRLDYLIMVFGAFYAWFLSRMKVNPTLVLGGFFMPPYLSLPLFLGGISTLLFDDKERYVPFWSGVFAANSLWMVVSALLSRL